MLTNYDLTALANFPISNYINFDYFKTPDWPAPDR